MKKLLVLLLALAAGLQAQTVPLSQSLNNIPTATSLTGAESYVIVQAGVGKKASQSLVSGIFQPLDQDLSALAALTNTGAFFYRSATGVWLPVTIGANLTFLGGTLASTGGGGGGSSIILDLVDDGANESTALDEIAIVGDVNSIFSEFVDDKLTINVGNAWPTATVAQSGDSATGFFSTGLLERTRGGLGADISGFGAGLLAIDGSSSVISVSTPAALETSIGAVNILLATELDSLAKLNAVTGVSLLTTTGNGSLLTGITGTQVSFADPDANFVSSDVQSAIAELDDTGSGPNATDGKVSWGQLVNVPAGFADGSDDGAGGSAGTMNTVKENGVQVGGSTIVTLDFLGADFDLSESPTNEINIVAAPALARDAEVAASYAPLASPTFTGTVTAPTFAGALTGNATTATSASTLTNARLIGGTSFNGSTDIVPQTSIVADSTDSSSFIAMVDSATGNLQTLTDAGLTYNSSSGMLTATGFTGPLTGNATTATLAATGDSATAFFTLGALELARGGLGIDVSGFTNGLYGQISSATVDIDTTAEFSTALGLTGTPSVSTFLRGDGSWQPVTGVADFDTLPVVDEAGVDLDDVVAVSVDGTESRLTLENFQDWLESLTFTYSTLNVTNAVAANLRVLDAVNQSHSLSFIVSSDLVANQTFTYAGAFNFAMTLTGNTNVVFPTSGTLATTTQLGQVPSSDDPDISTAGALSWDTDGWLRAFDGTNQVAIGQKIETIQVTVIAPNALDDSERDAFWTWSNESGMNFIVTGWKGWSDTDNTTLNIEEINADGTGNVTVDAVEIATNGTGLFTGADTAITGATIENGHVIQLDFDDADLPGQVKMTIVGYYDANVN